MSLEKTTKMIYDQVSAFALKNNLTLLETSKDCWNIYNGEQIIISAELSFHDSKIIVELTGYLSTEMNVSATSNLLHIINSDKIKEQINDTNIELFGTLLLNSKTLIIDKQFRNEIKYLVLLELCAFDFDNRIISKLISKEYYNTFMLNLN